MIKIEHTREGKQIVLCAWIRGIADEGVDPILVEREPGGVEVSYDSGGVDEITIVEMMIVIECVAEVLEGIACYVASGGNNSIPDRVIH